MGTLNFTTEEIDTNLGWVIGKESNEGVKVDVVTPTYPWHDLIGQINPDAEHPTTSPELVPFRGAVRAYTFASGRLADLEFHMPHDYLLGSDVFIHTHWSHNGVGITGDNVMSFECTTAKRSYTPATPFTPTITTVLTVPTNYTDHPQYGHMVDEIQLSSVGGVTVDDQPTLDTDDLEIDGLVLVHFKQDATPSITGGTSNEPFVLTIDIHYQSTGIGTKSSAPDYYGV